MDKKMALEEKIKKVLQLKVVHGVMLTTHDIVKPDFVKEAMEYQAEDGDVILNAYMKTGSTWLMYIIWGILHKGAPYHDVTETYHKYIPCIEIAGSGPVESLQSPRYYKHHLACQHIRVNRKAKYIYIHRRPEDVMASFYHFNKFYVEGKDLDFDLFFEAFMRGMVWYGGYFDHVLDAYKHKKNGNFLFVSYEKLKSNTRSEILRIAEFLGEEYASALRGDDELMAKIIRVTGFDYMKENLNFDLPVEQDDERHPVDFFRKGVVGDGKNLLSPEQRERLSAKIREQMAGTEFVDTWLS